MCPMQSPMPVYLVLVASLDRASSSGYSARLDVAPASAPAAKTCMLSYLPWSACEPSEKALRSAFLYSEKAAAGWHKPSVNKHE